MAGGAMFNFRFIMCSFRYSTLSITHARSLCHADFIGANGARFQLEGIQCIARLPALCFCKRSRMYHTGGPAVPTLSMQRRFWSLCRCPSWVFALKVVPGQVCLVRGLLVGSHTLVLGPAQSQEASGSGQLRACARHGNLSCSDPRLEQLHLPASFPLLVAEMRG